MPFHIVVPVFNAESWIADCVRSIQVQTERDFRCTVLDDASSDRTGSILDSLPPDERFEIVHNAQNVGALANIVAGFRRMKTTDDPDSVLVTVDGDDWLAHERVLETVRKAYESVPGCLLTYGNSMSHSIRSQEPRPSDSAGDCRAIPDAVIKARAFRKHSFVSSHLRTFKSRVWNNILDRDLRDPRTGGYFRVGWDVAMMVPMLEMAGGRFKFIEEVLYVYNDANPISDRRVRLEDQTWVANYIKGLPKYPLLKGKSIPRSQFALKRRLLKNPLVWRLLAWRHRMLERNAGADV